MNKLMISEFQKIGLQDNVEKAIFPSTSSISLDSNFGHGNRRTASRGKLFVRSHRQSVRRLLKCSLNLCNEFAGRTLFCLIVKEPRK
jgi:hypothetical protein